jgi:hypothetical protein
MKNGKAGLVIAAAGVGSAFLSGHRASLSGRLGELNNARAEVPVCAVLRTSFCDSRRSTAAVMEPLVSKTFLPMTSTGCGPL